MCASLPLSPLLLGEEGGEEEEEEEEEKEEKENKRTPDHPHARLRVHMEDDASIMQPTCIHACIHTNIGPTRA